LDAHLRANSTRGRAPPALSLELRRGISRLFPGRKRVSPDHARAAGLQSCRITLEREGQPAASCRHEPRRPWESAERSAHDWRRCSAGRSRWPLQPPARIHGQLQSRQRRWQAEETPAAGLQLLPLRHLQGGRHAHIAAIAMHSRASKRLPVSMRKGSRGRPGHPAHCPASNDDRRARIRVMPDSAINSATNAHAFAQAWPQRRE
jgi:hypothetical protein